MWTLDSCSCCSLKVMCSDWMWPFSSVTPFIPWSYDPWVDQQFPDVPTPDNIPNVNPRGENPSKTLRWPFSVPPAHLQGPPLSSQVTFTFSLNTSLGTQLFILHPTPFCSLLSFLPSSPALPLPPSFPPCVPPVFFCTSFWLCSVCVAHLWMPICMKAETKAVWMFGTDGKHWGRVSAVWPVCVLSSCSLFFF